MEILFQNNRLRKEFNDHKLLVRRYGGIQAKLIERRLVELRAANTLEDLRTLRQVRCHELKGNRAGQYSIRINDQYRICFEWRDGDAY